MAPTHQLGRAQAVARFGLGEVSAARVEPLFFEVWAENWTAVRVFDALRTQWIKGALGGELGLRYEAVLAVLQMMTVPRREWPDLFEALREMEGAGLKVFAQRIRTSAR